MRPPDSTIEVARLAAMSSGCAKSHRGAAVFDPENGDVWGTGFNGQPQPLVCGRNDECKRFCGRTCLHAESRAIRNSEMGLLLGGLELVHVKVVGDEVVPGGPPSCEQCSREILDVGLEAVWLYEIVEQPGGDAKPVGIWARYGALDFHLASLHNAKGGPLDGPLRVSPPSEFRRPTVTGMSDEERARWLEILNSPEEE